MKITKNYLRKIILEEIQNLEEGWKDNLYTAGAVAAAVSPLAGLGALNKNMEDNREKEEVMIGQAVSNFEEVSNFLKQNPVAVEKLAKAFKYDKATPEEIISDKKKLARFLSNFSGIQVSDGAGTFSVAKNFHYYILSYSVNDQKLSVEQVY
jgi:hypothetical protein